VTCLMTNSLKCSLMANMSYSPMALAISKNS
jgi:hypothetical protein